MNNRDSNSLETYQFIKELVKSLPYDLRVEVIVDDLLNNGIDLDDFFVKPAGIFKRRFGKDILGVEKVELENGFTYFLFDINREGLYDMLPQGLFHNPPEKGTKAFQSAAEMANEVKNRKKEENEARDYFLIYEIELYRQRLLIENFERKLNETIAFSMDDDDFLSYWELPEILSHRQKGIIFYLYPIIENIRGNLKLMELVYRMILTENVNIEIEQPGRMIIRTDSVQNTLGDFNLGYDLILGNSFMDSYPVIKIKVGPILNSKVKDYIEGGTCLQIIEILNRLLTPVYCDYKLELILFDSPWKLQKDESSGFLGFNTVLGVS